MTALTSGASDLGGDFQPIWDAEDMACDTLGLRRQAAWATASAPTGDPIDIAIGVPGVRLTEALRLADGRQIPAGVVVAVIPYPSGEVRVLAAGLPES